MLTDAIVNRPGPSTMQSSQSYPSPTAAASGEGAAGPFFSQQHRMPSPDHLQLSAQMAGNLPSMAAGSLIDDGEPASSVTGHQGGDTHQLLSQAEQLIQSQGVVDLGAEATSDDARRKRTKTSRACDECRRKKIRCDASAEEGEEQTQPCSNCKRSGHECAFSRVPMKRGPSKGYIKELADRVNTLEHQMIPATPSDASYLPMDQDAQSPRASEEYSPPSSATTGQSSYTRKRTFSAANDRQNPNYLHTLPQRPAYGSWSTPEISRHLPYPGSGLHNPQAPRSTSSVSDHNHLQSHRPQCASNGAPQPFWRVGPPDMGRRDSISVPYESGDFRAGDLLDTPLIDWDNTAVDQYYQIIHPTFPLLPNSKARLQSRLTNCPVTLRTAFLAALYAAVRSFPTSNPAPTPDFKDTKKAADLIIQSQFENAAMRTLSTNLIYLQSMILMALEADNHGPATMKGQLGPPRAVWLGSAVGLAYYLGLHRPRFTQLSANGDLDSDEKLGRRIWWVMVILDRWHASSTSSPLLIPDTSVVLMNEDQILLGDSVYHLARLSCIVGHLAEIFVASGDPMAPSSPSAPLIGKLLGGEIERFRESLGSKLESLNLVYLSYYHVQLLMKRHRITSEPHHLLRPAQRMASVLNSNSTPMTPLNHHFAALAALTLVELADIPETRDAAWKGIRDLHEALDMRRGFYAHQHSTGWDSAIRDLVIKKEQQLQSGGSGPLSGSQGGLQHLAELAVSGAASNGAGTVTASSAPSMTPTYTAASSFNGVSNSSERGHVQGFDPTVLTRLGYLAVLVQDRTR